MSPHEVIVELYGVVRARAGRTEVTVHGETVAAALEELIAVCPSLRDLRRGDGRLAPHYLLSLDGSHFVTDLAQPLRAGDRLVLLSADAGG
jgi:molybdopterin converting factor small subunit